MLPELSEADARGEKAVIYNEIRTLCGVSYVSSLQRYLATREGWLEWAWSAVRPVFVSGLAQHRAWASCDEVEVASLPPISISALSLMGVNEHDCADIRNVCANFIRVSPINLVFSGLVARLLDGTTTTVGLAPDSTALDGLDIPPALPPPVAMVDLTSAPADLRTALIELGVIVDGQPFVPGLYRMLAHWPAYYAHVAVALRACMMDEDSRRRCKAISDAVDTVTAEVFSYLPPSPISPTMPAREQIPDLLSALDRYRVTSAQMILFSAMIRDALP